MSICTFCYLYSLAICYKTNRKSKVGGESFRPAFISSEGAGSRWDVQKSKHSFYCASGENGWRRCWLGSAVAAATLQLLQGRRGQDAHRGQLESSKRLYKGLQCKCTALAWLFCRESWTSLCASYSASAVSQYRDWYQIACWGTSNEPVVGTASNLLCPHIDSIATSIGLYA